MSTQREAEEIIRNIRKSRHADGPGGLKRDANARSLSRALDMLSAQLYTKPTHFILELIQNADDNTYASGLDPCLTLAYREDGYLWIGCNEVGFSKANVEAICEIADSTKKVEDSVNGYIGEKGIGFKSVFKVADVVWISSGHFTFRFDRDQLLGMVVPIWHDFNSNSPISAQTMFCLQIPDLEDRRTVKSHLMELRAELLLFLRKLVKIEVKIYGNESEDASHHSLIRCEHNKRDFGTISTLTRQNRAPVMWENKQELLTLEFSCKNMPDEERRHGIKTTNLVLGFPTSRSLQCNRSIYNFLPIRPYGLSFLFQADFVLTANRGDIVEANLWNKSLVARAIEAFVRSVKVFNRTGICKYDWPLFVGGSNNANGTIMEDFVPRLRQRLMNEHILENQAGTYAHPSSLVTVPVRFTDGGNPAKPLLDKPDQLRTYVSRRYNPADLRALGVKHQTAADVHRMLKSSSLGWIKGRGSIWHCRLAAGIVQAGHSSFWDIKLIPLRDGRWVSANDGPIYFPNTSGNVVVPEGIEVNITDEHACANESRREMFMHFGAQSLTEKQICNLILDRHRCLTSSTASPTLDCMISHAWYLFSFGSSSLDCRSLKLAAQTHSILSASHELYMDLPGCSFYMKDYFLESDAPCEFLHCDYLTYGSPSRRPFWHEWLQHRAGVSTLPKLFREVFIQGSFGRFQLMVSPEFQYLIDQRPSKVWLVLLRDHWSHYQSDAVRICDTLGSLLVDCKDGRKCELRDTYLATSAVTRETLAEEHVSLIEVPNPEHRGWLNLHILGLHIAQDLHFFLSILLSITRSPPETFAQATLTRLYQGIERHFNEDPETARSAFSKQNLIGLISSYPNRWLSLAECRWRAQSCLETLIPLQSHFSQFKTLFVSKLGVANAGPSDVLDEILGLSLFDRREKRAKDLLLALAHHSHLGQPALKERFRRLAGSRVIPVRLSPERTDLRSGSSDDWFIADRQRHLECFADKVWLFDFDTKQITLLEPVIEQLRLTERRLSKHAVEETITSGDPVFHYNLSHDLQAKASYISLLVSFAGRDSTLSRLQGVQIWSSSNLVLRRYVEVNNERIFGKDEIGRVVLEETGNSLCLYCSTNSILRNKLPWPFIQEKLSVFFDIPQDRQIVLNSILMTSDHDMIKDILERANLLTDAYDHTADVQARPDSEFDTDEEPNGEVNGVERALQTPNRRLDSTSYSNSVDHSRLTSPQASGNGHTPSRSSARRVSSRREPQIINVENIVRAADTCDSDDIRVLGPPTNQIARIGAEDLLRGSASSSGTTRFRRSIGASNSPSRDVTNGSSSSRGTFKMGSMSAALPIFDIAELQDSDYPAAGDREKEIGYGGELYTFKLLQRIVGAGEACWTSNMRSRYGLPTFTGAEGAHSDFTLSETEEVPCFTNWLLEKKFEKASKWLGREITYHLEVKTTLGDLTEPFMMSNNQVNLAREWHDHLSHVYIILRVYHLNSNPSFIAYVDPFALMIAGELSFTAQRGYCVQPGRA